MKLFSHKPSIIILHGWNLSGEKFAPLADGLRRRGYRVFTPDLPGFGKEPAPGKPWHVEDYTRFVREWLRKKRIRKPVFIGHSFGGRVSLKYSQMFPEDVESLILAGTPGFSPVPQKKLIFFLLVAKVGRLLFSLPPLNFFADWARRWLYYLAGVKEFFRAEGSMRQTFKNIVQDDLVPSMESVKVPCLLLWGEYDLIVPVAIAHRMEEVIPRAQLKVIPEADHGAPYKLPEIFVSYVDVFLNVIR